MLIISNFPTLTEIKSKYFRKWIYGQTKSTENKLDTKISSDMVVAVLYGIICPFIYSSTLPLFHLISSFAFTYVLTKKKKSSTISFICYFNVELVVSELLMEKGSRDDRLFSIYRQTRILLSVRFT